MDKDPKECQSEPPGYIYNIVMSGSIFVPTTGNALIFNTISKLIVIWK